MTLIRGDKVRIPAKTLGHDNHDVRTAYTVERTYPDGKSVKLKGLPSVWPVSRLRKV